MGRIFGELGLGALALGVVGVADLQLGGIGACQFLEVQLRAGVRGLLLLQAEDL